MKTATMIFKTEPKTRAGIQKLARRFRVSSSFVLDRLALQAIQDDDIPFEEYIPNAETARAIRQDRKDVKNGKMGPVFHNVEDFIADLEKSAKKQKL